MVYKYQKSGKLIYEESFKTIRSEVDLSGFSTSSWSRTRLGSRVWIYVVLWLEVDEGRGDSANGVVGSHTVRTKVRFPPFRDMFLFLLRLFTLF